MAMSLDRASRQSLDKLLSWYEQEKRELPWRRTSSPYRIWVSEVMLQQTQVSRGVEYYKNFLRRFPSLTALSNASWNSVLPVWRGLGYYNRGRNLLKAAKIIKRDFAGRFPRDYDSLCSLPGVGPYTAKAIQSFAFNLPVLTVDTNVRRVFSRFFGCPSPQVESRGEEVAEYYSEKMRLVNQALMDLGASVCKSRLANCERCPLSRSCHFFKSGDRDRWELELKEKRESQSQLKKESLKPVIEVGVACIHRSGKYLIGKRPQRRGGLWEFPGGKREAGESIRDCLKREIQEELGLEISVRPPFLKVESKDDSSIWRLYFCRCQILRGKAKNFDHDELRWVTPSQLGQIPFPKANRTAVEKLSQMR